MNEQTIEVLKKRIDNHVSKLAYNDYVKANFDKNGKKYKKHHPYSLSGDTVKAKEMLNILYQWEISKEDEEKVKAYIMVNGLYKN
jgi:hypothetical protein